MRVVVLGGTGNFGARIVRGLLGEPGIDLVATGRRERAVAGAEGVPVAMLDLASAGLHSGLAALKPDVVVHTVGPFQGQDYRVAQAALACGAHYLDLADGRAFVSGFAQAMHSCAKRAGRAAISGASTLPALSTAVVDELVKDAFEPESIEVVIAPGQLAPRGVATLQAVFSYLGRPVRVWERGQWMHRTGWMDLRRVPLDFGSRWGALCDVPDLELLPARYPTATTVRFHAALEFRMQHAVLWGLAGLIRLGLPVALDRWCARLDQLASGMDRFGGEWGGMRVSVVGKGNDGRVRRTWQLKAPALNGPEIPCMASLALVRKLARGEQLESGARDGGGVLSLADFQPQFESWGIRTEMRTQSP